MSSIPLDREQYLALYKDIIDAAVNKKVYLPSNLVQEFIPIATYKVIIVGALAIIPGAGTVLSNIVYTIFTFLDEKKANDEANIKKDEDIKMFTKIATEIVDNKIDTYDYNLLSQLLVKCKNALKVYHDSITIYKGNKTVLNKSQMQNNYSALLKTLSDAAVDSQKKDYSVQELPFYTIFITGYLLLLREGILNCKELGYDDANVQVFQNYFDETIAAAKTYCEEIYKIGLEKVKLNEQDYALDEFNNIIKYRNCMITSCFDFVAIWPFLNPSLYPKNLSFEYCRYLFSPAFGYPYYNEMDSIKREDYLNVVSNFEFYQKELNGFKIGSSNRIANIQPYFWNANDPNKTITGTKFGGADTGLTFVEYTKMNNYLDPVHIESCNFPTKLGFKGYPDVSSTQGFILPGENMSPDIKITSNDVQYPGHKLGNLIGYYTRSKVNNGIIGAMGFVFAHESTFSANVVTPNAYNVFNGQKTKGLGYNSLKLDKDSYSIGTHGVVFGPNITATYQIYHPGQATTTEQLDYKVWLMVKSDVDFSIAFQLFESDGTTFSSLGQFKGTGQPGVIQTIKKNASNNIVKVSLTLNQPIIKFNLLNKFDTNVTLINIILVPVVVASS